MNFFDMNSEVCNLRAEDEPSLASFTQSLIEIAAAAEARGSVSSPTAALNAMRLPAIALDQHGFIDEVNAAAEAVFDNDVKIKDRRLFVRDPAARALPEGSHRSVENLAPSQPIGYRPDHRSAPGQNAGYRANLAFRRGGARARAGSARAFDVECLGAETRAARGDPRQDLPPYACGGEARLRHRTPRLSRYRGPGIEDFTGDGAQSVEIGLCQDRHASPKRTCRAILQVE